MLKVSRVRIRTAFNPAIDCLDLSIFDTSESVNCLRFKK